MTNPERDPDLLECLANTGECEGVEILTPRDVPLGGPRAMGVRRTLPQRQRSFIGAWCFLDHYGPDDVGVTGGMKVAPHPHTGLQTVSWLFAGEITHRDSAGNHAMVRPGEVNLMTAGRGISHSEISGDDTEILHGAQLWVALPDHARHTDPDFAHHAPQTVTGDGWAGEVFLGSLLGDTSPVDTFTPLLGAELRIEPGTVFEADVRPDFEHGVLVDTGVVDVLGREVKQQELAYLPTGLERLRIEVAETEEPVRLLLLGGEPFGESIVMWWNFVGRSHEEVVAYREEWQAQIRDGGPDRSVERNPDEAGGLHENTAELEAVVDDSQLVRDGRYGVVVGDHLPPIPAPPLPNVRLKHRS